MTHAQKKLALLLCTGALLAPSLAHAQTAQVPGTISYQGRLLKADGTPESGVIEIDFALFSGLTGGSPLWSESQQVGLTSGFYQLFLGSVTAFPSGTFDGTDRYLEVTVAGSVLTPRQKIASVPYAMLAGASKSVNTGGLILDASGLHTSSHTVFASNGILDSTAVNPAVTQLRVTGTCAAGTFLAGINQDGSVSCAGVVNGSYIQNGTAQQTGAFNVSGAGTVGGNLAVGGDSTLGGALSVTGNTTLGAVSATSANVGGDLAATGSVTAGSAVVGAWPHDGASAMFAANQGAAAGDYAGSFALRQSADGQDVYLNHGLDGGIHLTANGGGDLVNIGDTAVTFHTPSVSFPNVGSGGMTIDGSGISINGQSVINGSGGIATGAIDTTKFQARVTGTCPASAPIISISATGTVGCGTDDSANTTFIHNGVAAQPSASFNVSGSGQVGGTFTAGGAITGKDSLTLTGAATITDAVSSYNYVIVPQAAPTPATQFGLGQAGAATYLNHPAGGITSITSGGASTATFALFSDVLASGGPGIQLNAPIAGIATAGNTPLLTVEHANGTQGVAIGYDTVRTSGSNPSQDLHLAAQGSGAIIIDEYNITSNPSANLSAVPALYFGEPGLDSDPIFLARFPTGDAGVTNQSDLVLNLGDDLNNTTNNVGDRFRITTTGGVLFADGTADIIRVETSATAANANKALVTINSALVQGCRPGFLPIADGHLCFGSVLQAAGDMDVAIGTCRGGTVPAHVCTHNDFQQACGAGVLSGNPYSNMAAGWYGDHGANSTSGTTLGLSDDYFLVWNEPNCSSTNNDGPAQNGRTTTNAYPYRCCY